MPSAPRASTTTCGCARTSPAVLLAARTYGTDDRLVIEVAADATDSTSIRWRGRRAARRAPPPGARGGALTWCSDRAALGAIVLGGARPSMLARARRIAETTTGAVRRADAFFAAERLPHSQNPF